MSIRTYSARLLSLALALAACGGNDNGEFNAPLEPPCGAVEDKEIDGSIDLDWTITTDGRGFIVREDGIPRGDTYPSESWIYEWRDDGMLVSETHVVNGEEFYRRDRTWDGPNLTRQVYVYEGRISHDISYTYQGDELVSEAWDWDFDGDLESKGLMASMTIDWAEGTGPLEKEEYLHEDGRIVGAYVDIDADAPYPNSDYEEVWLYEGDILYRREGLHVSTFGDPNYYFDYVIDENGLWTDYAEWHDGTGLIGGYERVLHMDRDSNGYPIAQTSDYTNFGSTSYSDSWAWQYDGNRMTHYEARSRTETTAVEYSFDCPAARTSRAAAYPSRVAGRRMEPLPLRQQPQWQVP